MKHFLSIACLLAWVGLASFRAVPHNTSQLTLVTASGETIYRCGDMGTDLTESGDFFFEFKQSAFSSGDAAKDENLYRLMLSHSYPVVDFSGKLEKSVSTLKPGASISTAAIGKMRFAGRQFAQRIPLKVTRMQNGDFAYTFSVLYDCKMTPATVAIAQELGVTEPLRLTFTPVVK